MSSVDIDKVSSCFGELLPPSGSQLRQGTLDRFQQFFEEEQKHVTDNLSLIEKECIGERKYEEVQPEWYMFRRILRYHEIEDADIINLYFIKWYFKKERLGEANRERKALEAKKDDILAIEEMLWKLDGEREALQKRGMELHQKKKDRTPEEEQELSAIMQNPALHGNTKHSLSISINEVYEHYVIGGATKTEKKDTQHTIAINDESLVRIFSDSLTLMLEHNKEEISKLKAEITGKINQHNRKDGPGDEHERLLLKGLSEYMNECYPEHNDKLLIIGKMLFWCGTYVYKGRKQDGSVTFNFEKGTTVVPESIYNIYDENLHNRSEELNKFVDAIRNRIERKKVKKIF